ncbi:MAG TPA: lipopolysaccharide transport periplasmic protein LptA [Sideroxyarcus sp.]|nr:lipopolysaccharide transport periplasmic protein LptA [Sideroxyarcus sp.]
MSRSNKLLSGLVLLCCAAAAGADTADREKPIHLEADRVDISEQQQVSVFSGAVKLTQGTLVVQADKIVVTQDKHGYKHLTATGRLASFRQRHEGTDEYMEGYGERIEYDTRAEKVDFYVRARVKREQDDVQGDHISYDTRTEAFQVVGRPGMDPDSPSDGRVRAVLQPKSKDAAAAVPPKNDALTIQPSSTLSKPKP